MPNLIQVTKIIETETGHRLTSYPDKCAHLHGHRYRWEVSVTAPQLDPVGFVIDYGDLKKILKSTVEHIDHAFLFHKEDPFIQFCQEKKTTIPLDGTNGQLGRYFILPFNPTSENIIAWMAEKIQTQLGATGFRAVKLTHIRLWETSNSFCDYTPAPDTV